MEPDNRRRNARVHFIEGALYIASGGFLAGPTVIPAIVLNLGGSSAVVGTLPLIIFVAFYLPQIVSALRARSLPVLKPRVLRWGMVQRMHVFAMALLLAVAAVEPSPWILPAFLLLLAMNQMWAGLVSPLWFDLLTRTTDPLQRGRLLGIRAASGALLSFLNSFVLTVCLATFGFSWGVAAGFGIAFAYQLASVLVQRNVVEAPPSWMSGDEQPHRFSDVLRILKGDRRMRRFLVAWGFVTAGASTVVFILPAATARFGADATAVGVYTIVLVSAQMLGAGVLGWLTDHRGTRLPLLVCGISSVTALAIAALADRPEYLVGAFVGLGIPLGAEMMARYNFAVEAAPPDERALYVGLMNVWLAPWQLLSVVAGLSVARIGYEAIFCGAILSIVAGLWLLRRIPRVHLA